MEPILAPLVTEGSLALRDLIGVMRKGVINSTAVKVEIFTKELGRNAGALNVPSGIADSPRRIPLKLLVIKL